MPSFTAWVGADHSYRDDALTVQQRALRNWYGAILRLAQDVSARADTTVWLDGDARLYAVARFAPGSERLLVIASNFSVGMALKTPLRIPSSVLEDAGLSGSVTVRKVLDEKGATDAKLADTTTSELSSSGFALDVPDQTGHVFVIEKRR